MSRIYLKNTLAEEIKIFRGIFIVLVINCVYFSKCVRILSKMGVCLKSKKIKQTSFSVNSLIRARRRCGCRLNIQEKIRFAGHLTEKISRKNYIVDFHWRSQLCSSPVANVCIMRKWKPSSGEMVQSEPNLYKWKFERSTLSMSGMYSLTRRSWDNRAKFCFECV